MKKFSAIICLCGIVIFKLTLCSADDGLTEGKLKETYKLDPNITDMKNYQVMHGETIKKPTQRILMKIEIPINGSKELAEEMSKLSTSKGAGSKKAAEAKPKESYVSHEIKVLKDLKKGSADEYIANMIDHGTYGGKKVLIIPRLGKNLKEYSSKPFSWDKLSKMGPCMIKALRFLHSKHYVHRNLKPEVFAFGTEEKVAPLKDRVYLFDVGLSEKYKRSNGTHEAMKKINEFFGEPSFASRQAMANMTQSRRDDIESLYYILAYLAGITSPFEEKDLKKLAGEKSKFCENLPHIQSVFEKSKITEVRVFHALLDFALDLGELFSNATADYEKEPEYDDLVNCFDQGLSEEKIKAKYKFVGLDKFVANGLIGHGNTTDDKNKTEVVMKLMKTNFKQIKSIKNVLPFKTEITVYRDLKKGLGHSLVRENICEMLDHGIYDGRRAIIMSRLGVELGDELEQNFPSGYPHDLLCKAARNAIHALRFVHNRGYVYRDFKLNNLAFGSVEFKKGDKSQADKPLKNRLYLFDFDASTKYRYANGTHKPRVKINIKIGTDGYTSRTSIMKYSQSRRDDMESLMFTLAVAAVAYPIFTEDSDLDTIWKESNEFVTNPNKIVETFEELDVSDERIHKAFKNYAAELNKLFVSDKPEYYEKEPDYNAFCVCFGGKPGDNACAVE